MCIKKITPPTPYLRLILRGNIKKVVTYYPYFLYLFYIFLTIKKSEDLYIRLKVAES